MTLARIAVASLGVWLPLVAPQARAQAGTEAALVNPVAALSLEALSATRERPLFSARRRAPAPPAEPVPPPAAVAAAPPPPLPPPTVALFGIVADPDGARAIVRAESSTEVLRLRVGDNVGGWEVSEIGRTELVLRLGDRVETIALFSPNARKAAPAAIRPPPRMAVAPVKRTIPKNFESDGL